MNGGGTGEEYLLRRLKKHDAQHGTEFAAKWARGEYASVRRAATAAGIVKVPANADSDKKRDPVSRVRMYWNRASKSQRRRISLMISDAGLGGIT